MIQESHSWVYVQRNSNWERYTPANVHSSTSHNSPDMEAT